MSTSVTDTTTVFGDRDFHSKEDFSKAHASPPLGKDKVPIHSFLADDDMAMGDRPFFIPIGKQGLIAALQQLDEQLNNVSFFC